MTSQKLNEEHDILRRFMAVFVSSAFKKALSAVAPVALQLPGMSNVKMSDCKEISHLGTTELLLYFRGAVEIAAAITEVLAIWAHSDFGGPGLLHKQEIGVTWA